MLKNFYQIIKNMENTNNQISFIPLGGIGDVTKNMYLYEYRNQILIVDCGLGFADETMLGVDLLLPDISYLLATPKKIVGMVLTHGHEDHIGGLPFILPQLLTKHAPFPILGTSLTAALANEKLKEFSVNNHVKPVSFDSGENILGDFRISFIRITHSVPDASNLFIKTPAGNFLHASDYKFDLTPIDGKRVEFEKIIQAGKEGITCLMSDCLGAEKAGYTPSEIVLKENFEKEIRDCQGKFIVTTYSSNISRLNLAIEVAEKNNRQICFIGRSLIKAKEIAQKLGLLKIQKNTEIKMEDFKNYNDKQLLLLIAGSQGQENSAMARVANGEHQEIKLGSLDVVVFSADPIPGNEVLVNSLIDTIAKNGTKVVYSEISDDFHVSGHGFSGDLSLMISLAKPKKLIPIGGTFRQMVAYKTLAKRLDYKDEDLALIEDGQEVVFAKNEMKMGRKVNVKNIYVDEITGEEVESFVLRDRQKLSEGGIIIILIEIDSATGQIVDTPDMIMRGFKTENTQDLSKNIFEQLKKALGNKKGRVTNWVYLRRMVGEVSERYIFKKLHRRPLILPVVIEV